MHLGHLEKLTVAQLLCQFPELFATQVYHRIPRSPPLVAVLEPD
jgi:hypothetical protein